MKNWLASALKMTVGNLISIYVQDKLINPGRKGVIDSCKKAENRIANSVRDLLNSRS